MTNLTVACVWVEGRVPYSDDYVIRLESMVKRHLPRPHRFVCLTDRPRLVPRWIETIAIERHPGTEAWWEKLQLFRPEVGLKGRVLYLDLDSVIVRALDPIVDYGTPDYRLPFAIAPHAGNFRPQGFEVVPRYNSSVMVWDTSLRAVSDILWGRWKPSIAKRLWGDQDWIGEQLPFETVMPAAWFPRFSEITEDDLGWYCPTGAKSAIVVLCKKPKNAIAAGRSLLVRSNWR